jgi:parallel beta-helix repeat protein
MAWGDTTKPAITRNVIWGNRGRGIVLGGMMSNSITENIVASNTVGVSANSLTGPGGIYYNDVWSNGTNWLDQATNFDTATGNISMDPLFTDPAGGDFHLRSIAGRYDPLTQSWVHDAVTSPCVDAGDPASAVGNEPQPNGNRINLGSDAGTTYASKSHTPWLRALVATPSRDFILSWASVPGNNYQVLYGANLDGPWSEDLPGSQLTAGAMVYSLSFTNTIATDTNLWFRVRMTPR